MYEFIVSWDSGKQKGNNNLLTEDNLNKVGISAADINKIESFFSFPGDLYTEDGVAKDNHPCCGSAGINIITKSNKVVSIQDIFYHDLGHKSGPYKDISHWNRENRFIDVNGHEERIPTQADHILEDSDKLTISFRDNSDKERKQVIDKDYPPGFKRY